MLKRSVGILGLIFFGVVLSACSDKPGEKFPDMGNQHIDDTATFSNYNSSPPTSGPHWNVSGKTPAPWGIHTTPIPNERQVHNLEHGGIMIQHNTQDQDLISQLRQFTMQQPNFPCFIILAPYPDMSYTIAVTAWGARDTMGAYDETRLQEFVDAYREEGLEQVFCITPPNSGR